MKTSSLHGKKVAKKKNSCCIGHLKAKKRENEYIFLRKYDFTLHHADHP